MSLCVSAVRVELVPPSMVSVFGDVVLSDSDHGFVESQTFSLSRKREAPFVEFQEDMNTGGTPKKTPPATRRKIRGIESGSVREKTVIENMGHYLDKVSVWKWTSKSWNVTYLDQTSQTSISGARSVSREQVISMGCKSAKSSLCCQHGPL